MLDLFRLTIFFHSERIFSSLLYAALMAMVELSPQVNGLVDTVYATRAAIVPALVCNTAAAFTCGTWHCFAGNVIWEVGRRVPKDGVL